MEIRPIIYSAKLSDQNVNTKAKVTVTIVADEIETYYAETMYAKTSDYELTAGQKIGVI